MTNNKALFLKWIKRLFYIHCVALVGYFIGLLPIIGSWFDWMNTIIVIATVYCLYKMSPVHERYRKAAMFSGIAIILTLITTISTIGFFSLVGNILSLIALYQEFRAHSEVLLTIDHRLSKKWRTLFNWYIFGSIIVAILGTPVIVLAAVAFVLDENIISVLVAILVGGFEIIIRIFYLVYLKRTHDICEKYEDWVDDVVTGDEI